MDTKLTYFSHNLTKLRKARGFSQAQLAKLANIPRSTLSSMEAGSTNATLSNVLKISKSLNISLDELLSLPTQNIELIKGSMTKVKRKKNDFTLYELLPYPVDHIELERIEISSGGTMTGSPHSKNTKEYFICLRGNCRITVEGEAHSLEKGDTLIFPGDCRHSYQNSGRGVLEGISVIVR